MTFSCVIALIKITHVSENSRFFCDKNIFYYCGYYNFIILVKICMYWDFLCNCADNSKTIQMRLRLLCAMKMKTILQVYIEVLKWTKVRYELRYDFLCDCASKNKNIQIRLGPGNMTTLQV